MTDKTTKDSCLLINPNACIYCNSIFTDKSSLSRHVNKRCSEKQKILDAVKEKDRIIDEKDKTIKKLEEDIEYFKRVHEVGNKTTNKSVNALSYLATKHKKTPPLKAIDQEGAKKVLEYKPDDDTLIEQLIYQFKNKTIDEYVGKIIVENYKDKNPLKQSIWNSDTSRFTYLIKEVVGDDSEWTVDNRGIKLKKYVIEPIGDLIYSMIPTYVQKHNKMIQKDMYNDDERDKKRDFMNYSVSLQKHISTGKFENDIIDFLAPHFRLNVNLLKKTIDSECASSTSVTSSDTSSVESIEESLTKKKKLVKRKN